MDSNFISEKTEFTGLIGYFLYPASGGNRVCSIRFAEFVATRDIKLLRCTNEYGPRDIHKYHEVAYFPPTGGCCFHDFIRKS